MDCIFCKIVKGEIPCNKVYEDDNVLVLLDIAPVNKGHCLVIPKEHHVDIFETPDELLAEMAKVVKKTAIAVKEGVGVEGVNVKINNGKVAGQVVFHHHIHVIPRFEGDGLNLWSGKSYGEGEADLYLEKIKNHING